MGKATEVPITPLVLDWALKESGFVDDVIAEELSVPVSEIAAWRTGASRPNVTQFRRLAAKLHRPLATFLLPEPPKRETPSRRVPRYQRSDSPCAVPRREAVMRRARRIQQVLAWIAAELKQPGASIKRHSLEDGPVRVGSEVRASLDATVEEQQSWPSPSRAFDEWRNQIESLGIAVFLFPLGTGFRSRLLDLE